MKKENILGFDVCNTNYNELINNIFYDFDNNISNFIVSINPEIVVKNYKNKKLVATLNSEKYQIPDGIGIVYASRIKGNKLQQRVTGIDLLYYICEESLNHNSRIFLYGSKEEVIINSKKELEKLYPNINIVGTCNGYIDDEIAIEIIQKANPNILFVGLGNPKQELFIIKNRDRLKNIKILMPVGGSFDVISKSIKRAPSWMIKSNLEWLHRLIVEPKRFFRQLNILKFIFLININKIRKGDNNNEQN